MKKKILACLLVGLIGIMGGMILFPQFVKGQDESILNDDVSVPFEDELDYEDVQQAIDDIQVSDGAGDSFDFKSYVTGLVKGDNSFSLQNIISDAESLALSQLNQEKSSIIQLIAIALIAAIFTSFTNVFKNSQIAETGFYVTYLLLFTLLTATFCKISLIASTVLENLLEFMKALLPTYFVGVAFCTGSKTSMMFYETTLFVIGIVDWLLIKILLPMINVYFVLTLANNIMKEDMLSKMADLMKTIISWSLKTLLGAVIGFNVIQGLIMPISDQVKRSVVLKTAQAIPGVGNAIGSATESVFAAAILIKNAIGVAGLIVIISICFVPVVKLAMYQLIYKFGAAIVQPISDKRILNCINATAQSAKLLMSVVIIASVLFLFTIVIITTSTTVSIGT